MSKISATAKGTEPEAAAAPAPAAPETPVPDGAAARYRVSYPNGLNLREGPGKVCPVVRVLPCGTEVEVIGTPERVHGSTWLPVSDGWVNAAYLVPDKEGV